MARMAPILISLLASWSALVIVTSGNNISSFPGPSLVPDKTNLKLLGRIKRQGGKVGFDDAEKAELLKIHNDYRRNEGAIGMLEMNWDTDLEKFAQKHTEKCKFDHTPREQRRNIGPHERIGENLYVTTGALSLAEVVGNWFDEKKFYNFDTMACTGVCGHYTQVVWNTSFALGCGVYRCNTVTETSSPMNNAHLVTCQYGPAGNMVGANIYVKGAPCGVCPAGRSCKDKLCALPSTSAVCRAHLILSTLILASHLIMF